jgi:NADH dehydrogenase FAD-containing subunit
MQASVDKIIASESDNTQAGAVTVKRKDGTVMVLEADFVVMGVGVAPATEFLKQSDGFPKDVIQRDGGIAVDEYLKVRGLEDVYAIGDIAFYPQAPTGESRRVEHWNVSPT